MSAPPRGGAPRALAGRTILVTRPRSQSRTLARRLRRLGARVVVVPTIAIEPPHPDGPLDEALRALASYAWVVVTSANGARALAARAAALGVSLAAAGPRWAAIGPATARALRRAGAPEPLVPSRYVSAAIADVLPVAPGMRVLLPRTDAAPPDLAEALRARGAQVDEVEAYRTVIAPPSSGSRLRRLADRSEVDTVVVTSASTVRGLVRLLADRRGWLERVALACIGPVTAAAAREAGLTPALVARPHTVEGLVVALLAHARGMAAVGEGSAHA